MACFLTFSRSQKRVRLDAQKVAEAEEVAELTKGVRAMHNDMTQLNALIAKDTARKVCWLGLIVCECVRLLLVLFVCCLQASVIVILMTF